MSISHTDPQEPGVLLKKIEEHQAAITKRIQLKYFISHDDLSKLERCKTALSELQRKISKSLNKNKEFSVQEKNEFTILYDKLATEVLALLKSVEVPKQIASDHRFYKKDINIIAFRGTNVPPEIAFEQGFSMDTSGGEIRGIYDVFMTHKVLSFSKNMDAAAFFPVPLKDAEEKKYSNSESYIYVVNLKAGFDVHAHGFLTMDQAERKEPQRFLFAEEICCDEVAPSNVIAVIKISRDFSNFNVNQGSNESKEDEYPSNAGGKYEITGIQYNPKALDQLQQANFAAYRQIMSLTELVGTERNIAGDQSGYTQGKNNKPMTPGSSSSLS